MSSTKENKKIYQIWNKQDKYLFSQLYKKYGTDFDKYKSYFPSRTVLQIRYFYNNQNHKNKVNKQPKPNMNVPQYLFKNLQNEDLPKTDNVANATETKENKTNKTENEDESFDDYIQ
ncbi:SANT/Myb_domain [Hexamita inflata]|uniref:SANT/Myb_domain n=1 Tax=Hexamita inflata TaxID=28002 RepID=A0ABP1KYA2_9EUKA